MAIPEIYKQHCKSKRIIDCPYLLHRDCKSSCAYAKSLGGMFVGSQTEVPKEKIKKGIEKLFKEDMEDY